MKTSVKVIIAALALSSFVMDGCKKGKDDPFMSIHTRKARVVGDWKVTQGNGTTVNFLGTTTWTYDGTTLTSINNSLTGTQKITMEYTFVKDGTYKMIQVTTTSNNTETETWTGTWNFTGKIGDDKNKDHIVTRELTYVDANSNTSSSQTTTYTGDNGPVSSYYLDELKNKEIIITWDGTTTPGASGADSDKGQYTLTAK